MTIYAGTIVDPPGDPFDGDPADALAEAGALLVLDGIISARGALAGLRAEHPYEPVTQLPGGMLVPGFIDTHVHFPQIRVIGGLGMPLLDWLERCALPEESKLADQAYAQEVAGEFLDGLLASGTTSALVFGSHFAPALDVLFAAAGQRGLNITSGLVLSDRILRPDLLQSPKEALAGSTDLIGRWHDRGRLRYAVTPRFSLSASNEMLQVCAQLLDRGVWFTSHVNENVAEVATVAGLFPGARALGLDDRVGDFSVGKDIDAVWLRPAAGSTLAVNLKHAANTTDALARVFSLVTPADVAGVWIRGCRVRDPR